MVLAHDPQQSMVTTMKERATAYVSGWNKISLLCNSQRALQASGKAPGIRTLVQLTNLLRLQPHSHAYLSARRRVLCGASNMCVHGMSVMANREEMTGSK